MTETHSCSSDVKVGFTLSHDIWFTLSHDIWFTLSHDIWNCSPRVRLLADWCPWPLDASLTSNNIHFFCPVFKDVTGWARDHPNQYDAIFPRLQLQGPQLQGKPCAWQQELSVSWSDTVQRQHCSNLGREANHCELSAFCGSTLGFLKEPQEWPCCLSRTLSVHIKALGCAWHGETAHS